MKKIFYLVAVATALLLTALPLRADRERIINPEQLPAAAKTFVKQYFPENVISIAQKEIDDMRTKYSVRLDDGTEIEFDSKGEWDSVDCNFHSVPAELIPAAIAASVENRFPGQSIVKINKERYGYELELSNDIELKFDKKYNLIGMDD
jgi:Protein of unknown function (DUF2874).